MSDDSLARSPPDASATAEADFDAIHTTIVATQRGRWFLDEYVRRYRGADTALPAAQNEILALLETIWQARGEVIGRHGDPAASGEAAIADFRYATEQLQGLVLAARAGDADPDPGGQLAFQLSRLGGAGDRLERSVAALRAMLGLFDEIEQRLQRLADAEPAPQPPAPGPSVLERLEAREYGRREQSTSARLPEPTPGPVPLGSEEPPAAADQPSVIDRLENMRTAIAELMDEVTEKTAGRIPPPARP
jgi:hypothetical protein